MGNVFRGVNEVIPVRGFNYNLKGVDPYRAEHPDQPIMGTEVASTVSTRGIYEKDTVNAYVPDYDSVYPPWASTAEQWWTLAANREWFMVALPGPVLITGANLRPSAGPISIRILASWICVAFRRPSIITINPVDRQGCAAYRSTLELEGQGRKADPGVGEHQCR